MSDMLDGLSNYTNLNSDIEALKAAQANSSASQSGLTDPQTFQIKMQQDFNQLLNTLMADSSDDTDKTNSDPFSFLNSADQSNATSSALDSAYLQQLNELEKNSPLLGRSVSYFDPKTGEQKSGKIVSIAVTASSASLNLSNGESINVGAVSSISE